MGGKSKKTKVIPLVSRDENGKILFTYHKRKNLSLKEKLKLKKYNPRTRTHTVFDEGKPQRSKAA